MPPRLCDIALLRSTDPYTQFVPGFFSLSLLPSEIHHLLLTTSLIPPFLLGSQGGALFVASSLLTSPSQQTWEVVDSV